MTKWYQKYLSVYEQPVEQIPQYVLDNIGIKLLKRQSAYPLVSVVVIAHNEERHILSCLWSLAENECEYPMDIIVVDNDSTDKTAEVCRRVYMPPLHETRKGPGFARQLGLDKALGRYYVCIDADTIYPKYYIQTMVKHLSRGGVVAVYGLWSFLPNKKLSEFKLFFYELFRDCFLILQNVKRPELNVRGMAMAFRIRDAREYGFRTDLIRGEDGSLALNLKNNGKIKMILSRRARPITDSSILMINGKLSSVFILRIKKMMKSFCGLFTKKRYYEDHDDNIIKKG